MLGVLAVFVMDMDRVGCRRAYGEHDQDRDDEGTGVPTPDRRTEKLQHVRSHAPQRTTCAAPAGFPAHSTKGNSTMDVLRQRLKEQSAEIPARLAQA